MSLKYHNIIQFKNIIFRNINKLFLAFSMIMLLFLTFTLLSKQLAIQYNPEFFIESNRIRTFTNYILSASQSSKVTVDLWKNQIEHLRNENNVNSEYSLDFLENNIHKFEIEMLLLSNLTFIIFWLIALFTIVSIIKTEIEESMVKINMYK